MIENVRKCQSYPYQLKANKHKKEFRSFTLKAHCVRFSGKNMLMLIFVF